MSDLAQLSRRTIHVRCKTHGEMKFRENWWDCVGFDGEGCHVYLTALEVHEVMYGSHSVLEKMPASRGITAINARHRPVWDDDDPKTHHYYINLY